MLQRVGVAKTPPADTRMCQSKDEELRKASSEGAILEKPEPPTTYTKPRTMSTSSADPRLPMKPPDSVRPDPLLYPKPALPERPAGRLPPKPSVTAKPPIPAPAAPAGGAVRPSSAPPSSSSAEHIQSSAHTHHSHLAEPAALQDEGQESAAFTQSPFLAPWRGPGAPDCTDKAQSVTEESLPKPRQHAKAFPQRRAVSVHEDTLAMTQELKAVLQRSPIRFQGNRWDLPSCNEDEAQQTLDKAESGTGKQRGEGKEDTAQKEELKAEDGGVSCEGTAESKPPLPGKEEVPPPGFPSSTAQPQHEVTVAAELVSDRPLELTHTNTGKSPIIILPFQKKSPVSLPQEKMLVSISSCPVMTQSEHPPMTLLSHQKSSSETTVGDQERSSEEAVSEQHQPEPVKHRTEPPSL